MLCTYLIFVALLGYHVQGASLTVQDQKTITGRLIKAVQEKCSDNSEEAVNQLKHVSYTCWDSVIPDLSQPAEKNKQVCREHVPGVIECLTKFIEKLEPCLSSEESFLKQFILDGYQKYSDYFCENIKAISFLDVIKTKGPECIGKFMANPDVNPHIVCYAKSKIFGDDASNKVITKSELCQDLSNVRLCYKRIFEEQCPNAPEVKEFQMGIMQGGLEQCSDE